MLRDDAGQRRLVNRREETRDVERHRPRRTPPVRRHLTQELRQPIVGGQGPLADAEAYESWMKRGSKTRSRWYTSK